MTNEEFLKAIFREDYKQSHVTSFFDDPNQVKDRKAWMGCRYKDATFFDNTNQYFTISLFKDDEDGRPRRRKADYLSTHCIVLDDVKEKLALSQAQKLPEPSWILVTSEGSEQWGYILKTPATDRGRVENLLDGLVANGLAPDGKDPGMKGVTRYVRLPEGVNNKASKCVDGVPYNCHLTVWEPERLCTLEDLAQPFFVNLDAKRRDARVDGAALVEDHPLLSHPDVLMVRSELSPGRYEARCPWVDEHTGGADNGAAVFTNGDGSLGFKCHHGHCESRTGRDLMQYLESKIPGFIVDYGQWTLMRSFAEVGAKNATVENLETVMERVSKARADSPTEQGRLVKIALTMIAPLPPGEQVAQKKAILNALDWEPRDLKEIEQGMRKERREHLELDFFSDAIYVAEQNQFFDRRKRLWLSTEAYRNKYSHLDPEALKLALTGGMAMKVDKLDYMPKMPPMYIDDAGTTIGNTWHRGTENPGVEGDCTPWLEHFDILGWGDFRDHILRWMAYTIRFPEEKINHALLLGGHEGSGKDWILEPLIQAMRGNTRTISGEELTDSDFSGYLFEAKHLHINEVEPASRADAAKIYKRLKPMTAAPPHTLRAHDKRVKAVEVTNIVNVTMTTNSKTSLCMTNGPSRRLLALWSDMDVRHGNGEMTEEWRGYWREKWPWMLEGGADACIWHLRNKVDLTDFYAKEAPPVSPFLQELVNSSKVVSIV